MHQDAPRLSDPRKGPPFINIEEHLNATNGNFTIPALNLSLNPPASALLDRPSSETPVPSAQNQSAVESNQGGTVPSPTPTLVGELDIPTGLRDVSNPSCNIPLTPATRSAPGNTRIPQFPIDVRPRKPFPSSRKPNPAQSNMDTSLPRHERMAPPALPSRSENTNRTFGEPDFDPRPAKRLKTSQNIQRKNGVSRVIQCSERRSHLYISHMLSKVKMPFILATRMITQTGPRTHIPSAVLYKQ